MEFGGFVELEPGIEGLIHVRSSRPTAFGASPISSSRDRKSKSASSRSSPRKKGSACRSAHPPRQPFEEEADDESENAGEDPAPPPRPEPKFPLKGGLGDRERRNR